MGIEDGSSRDEDRVWRPPGGIQCRMRHVAALSFLRQKELRSRCRTTMVGYWQAGDSSPGPPLAESVAQTGSGPSNLQDYEPLLAVHTFRGPRELDPRCRPRSGNHHQRRGSCPAPRATKSHMTESSGILRTTSEAGISHYLRHNLGLPSACDQAAAAVILSAFHEFRSAL